jgi:hypothetical protein
MRAYTLSIALSAAALILWTPCTEAKEPKGSAILRDGSTQEHAIIVTQSESTYAHWEHEYLRTHFPGATYLEHATIPDPKDDNKGYDLHVLLWRGQKKEVWFDISKPFQEFTRKHEHK